MNPLQLLLFTSAVLDQRDGGGALIEQDDGSLLELSTHCIPRRAREGDRLRQVRSTRSCPQRFRAAPEFNRWGGTPSITWKE